MTPTHAFRAVIQDAGDGGAYICIPFAVEGAFGKKRVKVLASLDGLPYRGSLVRMGTDCHLLPVLKDIRQQLGKSIGDEIEVSLEEDCQPRVVSVPPDLQAALEADPGAQTFFHKLSYTHQKEFVQWVEEAKRPETRQKRIQRTLDLLLAGKREP
jgi:hypothetical protein